MTQTFKMRAISIVTTLLVGSLSACGTVQTQVKDLEAKTANKVSAERERAARPIPVVATTSAAWLMGESVQVLPPPSPMLTRIVAYRPAQKVALSDVAAWITQATGLPVDTAEVQAAAGNAQESSPGVIGQGILPGAPVLPAPPSFLSGPPLMGGANFLISYEGSLSGLLDTVANKAGVWWKFADGRVSFFRTETKTFYIAAIVRKSGGNSSITTSSGNSSGTSSSGSGASSGGASSTSDYLVDVWGEMEKTAKAVGGGATVVANPSLGSLTVSGTPAQVRNVESWVKSLADNLSQQVAITVHVYRIKIASEDNYNWNPTVVFNSLSSKYGFTLAGPQAPATLSGLTPMNLAASVLQTATGSAAQYSGSSLALQALSTLGRVTETVQQTVVTMNGQPAPIQVANQIGYLASTTQAPPGAIGTAPVPPTLTPGTITTGFTAMFLPRVVNGKILLSMNLTSSSLVNIGSVGSGGSVIQTPNVDISTFQQSVSLTPGDALLLTGLQQDNGRTNRSGVGSPNNFALGGGVDDNAGKQLIAIVITAKVL